MDYLFCQGLGTELSYLNVFAQLDPLQPPEAPLLFQPSPPGNARAPQPCDPAALSRALLLHLHLGKKRDLISNSSFKNKGSLYLPPLFSHTFPHSLSFILCSSQPFLGSYVLYLLLSPPPPLSVIAFCTYLFIYLGLFSSAQLILYLLLYDTHNLWAAFYSSFNTFHFPSVFLLYIALPCLISASISHVLTNL